jgi:hypothetical protein
VPGSWQNCLMTNTPLPQNARRAIIGTSKRLSGILEEAAFQIAMDCCQDFPVSEDDDENERTIRIASLEIQGQILARVSLSLLLERQIEIDGE